MPPETPSPPQTTDPTVTERAIGGLFWTSSGNFIKIGLQLLVAAVLARLLSPAAFGVVAAALTVISFIEIFSLIGIGPSIIQSPILDERHIRTGFTITLGLGFLACLTVILLAPLIAALYRMPSLAPVLLVLALSFPLRAMSTVSESLLQRQMAFRKLETVNVVSYVLGYGVVGISAALAGVGVWALVIATLSQTLLRTIMLLLARPHNLKPLWDRAAAQHLLRLGSGMSAVQIFNFIARQGDYFVVGRILGAQALGIYSRAYSLMDSSTRFTASITNQVLFTTLSQVQQEIIRLRRGYTRSLALVAIITLPLSAFLILAGPEVIGLFLGPNWTAVVLPFQVLAVSMYFRAGHKVSDALIIASGAVHKNVRLQVVYATAVIGGAWIGAQWGISAVALAVTLALILHFTLLARLACRITNTRWQDFGRVHLTGFKLLLMVTLVVWPTLAILRYIGLPPVLILAGALCVITAVLLPLLWLNPMFMLGKEGVWLWQSIRHKSRNRRLPLLDTFLRKIDARLPTTDPPAPSTQKEQL